MKSHAASFFYRIFPHGTGKTIAGIGIVWLCVNTIIVCTFGIVAIGESEKYITQAQLFLQTGHMGSPNFWLYFIQIGLLAICIKWKLSFAFLLAIQLLFNLAATSCFYRTILYLFRDNRLALTGTLLFLFNYPYQQFNTYLQTESLFYSFTIIASSYIISIERPTPRKLITAMIMLAVICITRPTGLLFLPPAFLYLFLIYSGKMSAGKKIALLAFIGAGFFLLVDKALGSGGELDFMLPFRDEMIVCGVPAPPGILPVATTANGNSLYGLAYYIIHNPGQSLRLAGSRTFAFLGLYRSYFSVFHNIYLIVYFYSIHLMVLAGLGFWIKEFPNKIYYLASTILLTWFTVMLTCDDWHNRFYLSISPLLIILAMPSLQRFFFQPKNDRRLFS